MWVTLETPHPEVGRGPRTVRGRVTWIQRPRTVRELFQVGIEMEVPGNIWGIAFPPPDWFPFPDPAAAQPAEAAGAESDAASGNADWSAEAETAQGDNLVVMGKGNGGDASLSQMCIRDRGTPVRVCVKLESAPVAGAIRGARGLPESQELRAQFEQDPIVRAMLERFGGQISQVRRRSED